MPGSARVFPANSAVIVWATLGEKIYENFPFEIPLISMRPIFWSRDAVAT